MTALPSELPGLVASGPMAHLSTVLDKSTMTGLVGRAEKRGLLERSPNAADGRAVDVAITRAGARLGDQVHAEVAAALAPMTDSLSAPDRRRLQALLDRLLTSA